MHDDRCDIELCRELFRVWLRAYSDDPNTSNEPAEFGRAGIREFHKRFQDGEISAAELGLIVDQIMCW